MIRLLVGFLLTFVNSFEIINSVKPQFPKLLTPCPNIDTRLLTISNEISNNFPQFQVSYGNETTGYICNQQSDDIGYTAIRKDSIEQNTNIWISDKLLDKPNTLYNVVLHEVLHSMGLNHSNEQGMMNYYIRVVYNWYGGKEIMDDDMKLWISTDDRKGLIFLRRGYHLEKGV
jgi:hypothetical protein